MTLKCDRCGTEGGFWYAKCNVSQDFRADQPDRPPEAELHTRHLCEHCRGEFRRWLDGDGSDD